jgi:hypothetical protein
MKAVLVSVNKNVAFVISQADDIRFDASGLFDERFVEVKDAAFGGVIVFLFVGVVCNSHFLFLSGLKWNCNALRIRQLKEFN